MMEDSKYLAHFVQYLRPNAYGLGDGKHGYASLSQRFLHGDMLTTSEFYAITWLALRGEGRGRTYYIM
jgi:hypothetical protein